MRYGVRHATKLAKAKGYTVQEVHGPAGTTTLKLIKR
jgi:hypothetical protein